MDLNMKRNKTDDHEQSKAEGRASVRRRIPLKMFGKRFSSKRLLASSQVWMHTIPTEDCDIVLTLPASTSDATLMWLLARLRSRCPLIAVHFRHHNASGIYGLYMTASYESLLQGAEELGIRKALKSDFGGGMKEFVLDDHEWFQGSAEERSFLNSQERQSIVHHMLLNLRAVEGEALDKISFVEGQPIVPKLASKNIVSGVFPLHSQQDLMQLRKTWVLSFFSAQPLDSIMEYFGEKIGMYFAYLGHYTQWLVVPALLGILVWMLQGYNQWWEDVCWVAFSIFNVFWATLYLMNWKRAGAFLAYRWGTMDKKGDLLKDSRPLYKGDIHRSPVTGQLEPYYPAWRRNVFRYCVSAPIIFLCLCMGDIHRSPVTGQLEPYYPAWRRNVFRYCVSAPIIFLCLCMVFCVMLLIFTVQEWVNALVAREHVPAACRFLPKVLMAVAISVMDEVYKTVAVWLNNKENYRLEETHETNLVVKLVLFQFVNSFLALFYIAFYLKDMDRLREMLAALLITRQILGNIKEVLLPLIRWKGRLYSVGYKITGQMSSGTLDKEVEKVARVYRRKMGTPTSTTSSDPPSTSTASCCLQDDNSRDNEEGEEAGGGGPSERVSGGVGGPQENALNVDSLLGGKEKEEELSEDYSGALTQAEVESAMTVYDSAFEDYLEMVIQFGYVTLFSSAFPLAALCALLNNLIEVRSDAFKLCYTHQRPFGIPVEGIGIWQNVLQVMVLIAVIVNSALIGMGDLVHRIFPDMSDTGTVLLIVVVEHVILLVKAAVELAIPDVPHQVETQMARVEYQRREALKLLDSSGSERSSRMRAPDSPVGGVHSQDSARRAPFSSLSPTTSAPPDTHHALIGHRPSNFNTSNSQEGRARGPNPWEPTDQEPGSPPARGLPTDSAHSTTPHPPASSLPADERGPNPFQPQPPFRPAAAEREAKQIYSKSPEKFSVPNKTLPRIGAGIRGVRGREGVEEEREATKQMYSKNTEKASSPSKASDAIVRTGREREGFGEERSLSSNLYRPSSGSLFSRSPETASPLRQTSPGSGDTRAGSERGGAAGKEGERTPPSSSLYRPSSGSFYSKARSPQMGAVTHFRGSLARAVQEDLVVPASVKKEEKSSSSSSSSPPFREEVSPPFQKESVFARGEASLPEKDAVAFHRGPGSVSSQTATSQTFSQNKEITFPVRAYVSPGEIVSEQKETVSQRETVTPERYRFHQQREITTTLVATGTPKTKQDSAAERNRDMMSSSMSRFSPPREGSQGVERRFTPREGSQGETWSRARPSPAREEVVTASSSARRRSGHLAGGPLSMESSVDCPPAKTHTNV